MMRNTCIFWVLLQGRSVPFFITVAMYNEDVRCDVVAERIVFLLACFIDDRQINLAQLFVLSSYSYTFCAVKCNRVLRAFDCVIGI